MSKSYANSILDPRGKWQRANLKLAARVDIETLRKGPVVFYDNTKLSFCNYMEVFRRVKAHFAKQGITNIVDFRETVRGKTTQDLKDYAAKVLASVKPVAAVVALGDMGTSPATTIVTIALEELGIPSVYITAPPGADLVRSVAFYRAGHLCLCPVDIYQGSTVEEIDEKVDAAMPIIFDLLTLPGAAIDARASLDFGLDNDAPTVDGALAKAEEITLADAALAEPAAGIEEITDLFNDLHLGDGLPIIPPTPTRLERMMSYCPFDENLILAKEIGPAVGTSRCATSPWPPSWRGASRPPCRSWSPRSRRWPTSATTSCSRSARRIRAETWCWSAVRWRSKSASTAARAASAPASRPT